MQKVRSRLKSSAAWKQGLLVLVVEKAKYFTLRANNFPHGTILVYPYIPRQYVFCSEFVYYSGRHTKVDLCGVDSREWVRSVYTY